MRQHRHLGSTALVALAAVSLTTTATAMSASGSARGSAGGSARPADTSPPAPDALAVTAGAPFPDDRCQANRDAGTITYLTGFDFAAGAGMVDVFVAQQRGYFAELCLDVEIQPSFSTANYPLIASGTAQFASAGSFSEVLSFAAANQADLVPVVVEGRSPIDALILRPETAGSLEDLAGTTLGVKGKLPPSVAAMLATAGLVEGEQFDTVLLDGFDPVAHIDLVIGFPGYKSNEPGALERAEIPFDLFDPIDYGVPGSFGVVYTSAAFASDHPSATEDFVRATMRGLADAIAEPEEAVAMAMGLVTAGGNPNFLSPEGEAFRWETERQLIVEAYDEGEAYGVPDVDRLQAEVDAYADVGLFAEPPPAVRDVIDDGLTASVYDDAQQVIWPG